MASLAMEVGPSGNAAVAHEGLMHDLMLDLGRVTDVEPALDVLHHTLSGLGYSALAYGTIGAPRLPNGAFASPVVRTRAFPAGWDRHWDHLSDPYYRLCFNRTLALKWADVQNGEQLSVRERDCISHLDDRNLHYGITVPMHMPDGSFAFVSAISENPSAYEVVSSQQAVNLFFALCHYFQNHLFWNRSEAAPNKPLLSRREEECLRLAAQGKTSEDIAIILGLSCETVRSHVKRAILRLDATNRAHAVAKAIQLGLFLPN